MKFQIKMLMASAVVLCLSANAQDRIVGPSPSNRSSWDLFSEPGASNPSRQVAVGELTTPLAIRESKASHHRIELEGQSFWIKGSQVRISRGNTGGCMPVVKGSSLTISTPGAVKDAC